jgi:ATP/maltotriose-dependent transcriptional regulator MalT
MTEWRSHVVEQAAGFGVLALTVDELAAELGGFEDPVYCDADAALVSAVEVERAAGALGEEALVMRARLLQADMRQRKGEIAAVARPLWEVNQWAGEHDHRPLLARSHLVLARTFRDLGDLAACLEHSLDSVELLDDTTSPHVRVFYLMKLADALVWTGSYESARERYQQAERFAVASGAVEAQLRVLNNRAYAEYENGSPQRAWAVAERMQAVAATHGHPLSPNWLDTIGRVQVELGRYAEAEQTMRSCIERYDRQGYEEADALPEYLLTLAAAQRGLGAVQRAQESLDQCRTLCHERQLDDQFQGVGCTACRR